MLLFVYCVNHKTRYLNLIFCLFIAERGIIVSIGEPVRRTVEIGSTVTFTCKGISKVSDNVCVGLLPFSSLLLVVM